MLGIYDKGRPNTRFIRNVQRYTRQETKACSELQDLQNCKIAIAHIFNEEWVSLINKYSPRCSVRVRASTAGFSGHLPPTINDCVSVFHLRSSTDHLNVEEWQEILAGLSDKAIVASLVRGENPNGLRRFFVHEIQGYLAAIGIFCEGYLAVHAEHPNCHADIRPALNLMKWSEFRNSNRSQALVEQNLDEKMNDVRQPAWWLRVFERKSFYNDINKEWETTIGQEMPDALKQLLETILCDKSVEPQIAADAYYVLARIKTGTDPSEWQIRCNKLNHDWWKNRFLNSFDDFIVQLKKSKPAVTPVSEFLAKDFPAWKTLQQDAQWIVESFEDSMAPRRLLESSPLNRCDDETLAWLGNLVHGLWLTRYPVKRKVQESRDALAAVNRMYEKITRELEQSRPIELTKLIALRPQFCELKQTYRTFSKTLSNLPRYESHGR